VAAPDVVDSGLAHRLAVGHEPATPLGHSLRFGLQGGIDDRLDLVRPIGRLAAATRGDLPEPLWSLLGEPFAPEDDGFPIDLELRSNRRVGAALGGRLNDPAKEGDLLWGTVSGQPLLELAMLLGGDGQMGFRAGHNP